MFVLANYLNSLKTFREAKFFNCLGASIILLDIKKNFTWMNEIAKLFRSLPPSHSFSKRQIPLPFSLCEQFDFGKSIKYSHAFDKAFLHHLFIRLELRDECGREREWVRSWVYYISTHLHTLRRMLYTEYKRIKCMFDSNRENFCNLI